MSPADESLNLKQVAAELGVHYMTAYRYVRQGRLPAWRDGTNWRVDPAALASFVAVELLLADVALRHRHAAFSVAKQQQRHSGRRPAARRAT